MKRDLPAEDLHTFYARVIKRLGRNAHPGEHGILDPDDAARLWSALLDEQLTPPQEAAVLMGLRVHGESAAMLAAFTRETQRRLTPIVVPDERPIVVLPCLGTARRQPILAPLLALRLAALEVPVLVTTFDAERGANTTAVLHAMGMAPATDAAAAAAGIAAAGLAWLPVPALCPPLARLLSRRAELGFRNTAHSTIKLLAPAPRGAGGQLHACAVSRVVCRRGAVAEPFGVVDPRHGGRSGRLGSGCASIDGLAERRVRRTAARVGVRRNRRSAAARCGRR